MVVELCKFGLNQTLDECAQKLGQAVGGRQGALMEIEEILHGGGTPKNRPHRSAKLADKRFLWKQLSNIGRKLIVGRIADCANRKEVNGPGAAHFSHGKALHVDGQGIVLAAQLMLFLTEADHAIEGEQRSAMKLRHFIQPGNKCGEVKRDLAALGAEQRGCHDEVLPL